MGRQTIHDINVMRQCIKDGYCKELIMETMGIDNPTLFNSVKMRLLDEDKKYYQIPTRSELLKQVKPIKVTKNRNIILGKDILNICGFESTDEFTLTFTKYGFMLTKIVNDDISCTSATEDNYNLSIV